MTILRLEAWCDTVAETGLSIRIQEYAVLVDGRRLTLGPELGYTSAAFVAIAGGSTRRADPWDHETLASIESAVQQIEPVPYEVVFSERLRARVGT